MMQNSVRYYIVKSDNKAVVRSVPVTVKTAPRETERAVAAGAQFAAAEAEQPRNPGHRVGEIVRSAIRRDPSKR